MADAAGFDSGFDALTWIPGSTMTGRVAFGICLGGQFSRTMRGKVAFGICLEEHDDARHAAASSAASSDACSESGPAGANFCREGPLALSGPVPGCAGPSACSACSGASAAPYLVEHVLVAAVVAVMSHRTSNIDSEVSHGCATLERAGSTGGGLASGRRRRGLLLRPGVRPMNLARPTQ